MNGNRDPATDARIARFRPNAPGAMGPGPTPPPTETRPNTPFLPLKFGRAAI